MRSDHDLQLSEVLEFRPEGGEIRLHEQRVLLVSAAAVGVLRRELIAAVGIEKARELLLRFGSPAGTTTRSACATDSGGMTRWMACAWARCSTPSKVSCMPSWSGSP
jgi:hypothetical protein